jgi:hypothetical protein
VGQVARQALSVIVQPNGHRFPVPAIPIRFYAERLHGLQDANCGHFSQRLTGDNIGLEAFRMKLLRLALILMATVALYASDTDVTGTWKAVFVGPMGERPKMFTKVMLDLKVDGNKLTGMAHIKGWPGDAEITDGKIDGDRFSFTTIGTLSSSSGYPKMRYVGTLTGKEMKLTMFMGAVGRDDREARKLEMEGKKVSE